MKKSISFLLFIGILLSLCACSELAMVANPPEYFETVEKEDSSYKLYTVTPNKIIRGTDGAAEILLEAPTDENGITVLDNILL